MPKINKHRIYLFVPLTILLCGMIAGGSVFVWYYLNQFVFPLQPKVNGIFPSQPVWIYKAESPILSTPITHNSQIIFRSRNSLIAVDPTSGKQLWEAKSSVPTGLNIGDLTLAPQVSRDLIIVPEEGARMAAFSAITGQLVWRTKESNANVNDPNLATIDAFATNESRLFVARFSWSLSAYDIQNGSFLWERDMPNRATLYLQADNNFVYSSAGTILQVYDSNTGEIVWEKDFGSVIRQIFLEGNRLYIILPFGSQPLIAIDLDSQQALWSLTNQQISDGELRTITATGNFLYLGGDHLYALTKDNGSILWKTEFTGSLEDAIVLNSYVIVRNTGKDLFVFDLVSGQQIGHLELKPNTAMRHEPERSPTVYSNLLIVPFGDERIFAYQIVK
jgi:outer membrane protein assembly factor BamB